MKRELKQLMLKSPSRTLAVAESLTCGQVQARIGAIAGASQFFLGGVTAYTLEQKVKLLGVDREAARRMHCVSAEIAGQMACGACELFGSDYGLATTGYAQVCLDDAVTVPFAYWAIAARGPRSVKVVHTDFMTCPGAGRAKVQAMIADGVLSDFVKYLRGRP